MISRPRGKVNESISIRAGLRQRKACGSSGITASSAAVNQWDGTAQQQLFPEVAALAREPGVTEQHYADEVIHAQLRRVAVSDVDERKNVWRLHKADSEPCAYSPDFGLASLPFAAL